MSKKEVYVRYPKQTYSVMQDGLIRLMVEKGVGRNGWAIMASLCKNVFDDGKFAVTPSEKIQKLSGLTEAQVMRGMRELKDKGFITPVARQTRAGSFTPDRSRYGHVARYRFTRQVWGRIARED